MGSKHLSSPKFRRCLSKHGTGTHRPLALAVNLPNPSTFTLSLCHRNERSSDSQKLRQSSHRRWYRHPRRDRHHLRTPCARLLRCRCQGRFNRSRSASLHLWRSRPRRKHICYITKLGYDGSTGWHAWSCGVAGWDRYCRWDLSYWKGAWMMKYLRVYWYVTVALTNTRTTRRRASSSGRLANKG